MRYRNGALAGSQIVIWQFDQIKYSLTVFQYLCLNGGSFWIGCKHSFMFDLKR